MSLFRAQKLIDLACSTTHEEEARTAALTACRLIRRHGLRLTDEPAYGEPTRTPQRRARAAEREPPRAKPPNGGTWTKATRSSHCESCGGTVDFGEDVYVVGDVVWCARH